MTFPHSFCEVVPGECAFQYVSLYCISPSIHPFLWEGNNSRMKTRFFYVRSQEIQIHVFVHPSLFQHCLILHTAFWKNVRVRINWESDHVKCKDILFSPERSVNRLQLFIQETHPACALYHTILEGTIKERMKDVKD